MPMTVASLSSKGPANNALRKPDIAVPGEEIRSSRAGISSETIDAVIVSSGTSTATPGASAAAAIVCQFLEDRWYPNFRPSDGISLPITAVLIKSMLVASTDSLHSVEIGYGSPNLSALLLFHGVGLRIVPALMIHSATHHVFNVSITSKNEDLVVTMSYADPPLSVLSATPLYADLDLIVIDPTGASFFGNGQQDSLSTTEKVIVPRTSIRSGKYEIHVIASDFIFDDEVSYALVVRAPFDQI
jgi:hypothetical protein